MRHARPALLQPWLEGLPLTFDEGAWDHNQLCALLEARDGALLGPNLANLPRVLSVLAAVVLDDSTEDDLRQRVARTVQETVHGLPADAVGHIVAGLGGEDGQRVGFMMSMLAGHGAT